MMSQRRPRQSALIPSGAGSAVSAAPARLAAWTPLAVGPTASRNSPCRVAINHRTHERLRAVALRKFGRRGHASRLGSLVLDEYLRVIERAYYGRRSDSNIIMSRSYDAILFDMDGVLCDSERLSRDAGVETLRRIHGIVAKPDEFEEFTGRGEAAFLKGVAELHGVTDFDEEHAKQTFFDIYINGGFVFDLRPFPGARQLVARVKALDMRVAVASAADRVKVDANLNAIGLSSEFDFVASSELIERKKPDPQVFIEAAKGVGVPPSRCVVVEDAVAGVLAAKKAGMRCVAVATSMGKEELTSAGADVVRDELAFVSISDLLDMPELEEMEDVKMASEQESVTAKE